MLIARLFLKSSTYTHKIAVNCPEWMGKRLDKFSVWLSYKAANKTLASDKKIVFKPLEKGCCGGCCKKSA